MAIFKFTWTGSVQAETEQDAVELLGKWIEVNGAHEFIDQMGYHEIPLDSNDPYLTYPITEDDL